MLISEVIAYSSDRAVFVGAGLTISINFDKFFFTLSDESRAGAFCFQQSLINLTMDSRTCKIILLLTLRLLKTPNMKI